MREEGNWVNVADKNGFKKPSHYGCGKTVTLGFYEFTSNNLYYEEIKTIIMNAINSFKQTVKELMD